MQAPPQFSYYPDPFGPHDDAHNFAHGFSRGSSFPYPHHDYAYPLDRGEFASRPGLMPTPFDATGLGFTGNPSSSSSFVPLPEDIPVYQDQIWWLGADDQDILAPAPVYPPRADAQYFAHSDPPELRSPPAQLPTPAAMATFLNPHGRSPSEPVQTGYDAPPGSAIVAHQVSASAAAIPPRPEEPAVTTQTVPESLSREKKHACTMCHKRFDRPSTLRKHLLVHTGEKAFVCDTCGRRFGVASNLNRHVKRCMVKPVNTPSPSSPSATRDSSRSPIPASSFSSPMSSQDSANSQSGRGGKRGRTSTTSPRDKKAMASSSNEPAASSSASPSKSKPPGQKRRRRAPSPSQWVPDTLKNFNLMSEDMYSVTTVPLPPVRRHPPREERNSWDENVQLNPYHPCGWNGVLPGPGLGHGLGLGGKDVRNINLGGKGGHMLGRLIVF